MTEEKIIKGCQQGNIQCQKLLYEKYSTLVMSICVRYAGNKMYVEDLFQDIFVKLLTKIGSYTFSGSFDGWVRRLSVHHVLNALRNEKNVLSFDECEENIQNIDNENFDVSEEEIPMRVLVEMIGKLPYGYRMVFNMYEIEGYSHAQISEQLGCSEVTSRSQLYKAKKVLQQQIEQYIGK